MRSRYSSLSIVLSVLFLCVPTIRAQDGLRGTLSPSRGYARFVPVFGEQVAAADFDRDDRPDGAILMEAGRWHGEKAFRIELHLTALPNVTINFSSAETGLSISTLDVNRDGAPDIVLEKVFTHKRLKVYLNDGHGRFQKASPEAFPSPDESAPRLRAEMNVQDLPTLCIPTSRDWELAQTAPVLRHGHVVRTTAGMETSLVLCGARAPSASRAPPSLLAL